MAVLIEGISVVVKRSSIDQLFAGGWESFVEAVPNSTLCVDAHLARVGFLSPQETETFVQRLVSKALTFVADGRCVDIAVVDQMRGPTMSVDWLEYAQILFGKDGGKVAACWLFEGPRVVAGIQMPGKRLDLATLSGWTYENSLSARFRFVPTDPSGRQQLNQGHKAPAAGRAGLRLVLEIDEALLARRLSAGYGGFQWRAMADLSAE